MPERLSTGLAGLDAQFGGGVPAGASLLLIAEPMNAVDLFGFHFAAGSTKDSACHIISTELPPQEIRDGIDRVGGQSQKVEVTSLPQGDSWTLPLPKAGRHIIDNFSKVSKATSWNDAYSWLEEAKPRVRDQGGNLLVVATPGIQNDEEILWLRQWADGVFELGFDRQGFGLYPYLKVTKMRGVPDSARFLLFKETEKGLFMESTRRVF